MTPEPSIWVAFLPLLILLPFVLLGLALMVFWIWMLVDCATKEPSQGNDKIVWILVIVFMNWLGALIYYLARRPDCAGEIAAGADAFMDGYGRFFATLTDLISAPTLQKVA